MNACLRFPAMLLVLVAALATTSPGAPFAGLTEGMIAPADLLAPVDLQVTPLVGRKMIATRDGQLLPAVARADMGAADAAVREFDAAFARARAAFLDELERAFGARSIDEAKVASLRFQSFRSEFVAAYPEFPVGYVLAAAWAHGDDGEVVRARLAGVLRQVLARRLIGAMPRAGTVFVVALPRDQPVRAWSEASAALVRAVDGKDVVTLEAARAELWKNLGVGERFAGSFLETLVRETIRYDARLTALFLHERLGPALEGRFFGRGEVMVRAGEPVDAIAAEAMRQLGELGLAPLVSVTAAASAAPAVSPPTPAPPVGPPPGAEAPAAPIPSAPKPTSVTEAPARPPVLPTTWMLAMAALGVVSLGLGAWVYLKLRRLRGAAIAPAPVANAGADMREVLAREMTRQGMDALFSQRQELLKTTVVATERVAELETRVAKVQPAIQEKMQGYERRIKALERELAEK
ncbi:MAG: hypothetical protein IAE82_04290 [Opitutaceae bacterium]|nr:hypothetical protein [Opitutaceae bacterium]